jgi:hypothetical protein
MPITQDNFPIILPYDDGYDFEFLGLGTYAIVTKLSHTKNNSVSGELSIMHPIANVLLTDAKINFSYITEREKLAKQLTEISSQSAGNCLIKNISAWNEIIQIISSEIITKYRENQPVKIPQASLRAINDIQIEKVSWLWYPYIPVGKLTMLEGDPGIGKSWVSLAIATAISLGSYLPNQAEPISGSILLASAEDGLGDTIKPRLQAMGANQNIIYAIDGLFTLDESGFELLENWISETVPALCIIDPLIAFLDRDLDTSKANQVRWATARLARLAEKWKIAVIGVRHLTKGGNSKAIYRGLGSIDFTAAARSVLLAGTDPEDDKIRGVVHIKSNLARLGDAIGYELREDGFYWTDKCDLTALKILASSDGGEAIGEAKMFLIDILAGVDGMAANDVLERASSADISKRTLDRAKKELHVITYKKGEEGKRGGGKWYWKLPGDDD